MSDPDFDYATSTDGEEWPLITPPPVYVRRALDERVPRAEPLRAEVEAQLDELAALAAGMSEQRAHGAAARAWTADRDRLLRFLRGYAFDVKEAARRLALALDFRDEKNVWALRRADDPRTARLAHQIRSGKMYRHGFDTAGRPIIYMRDRRNVGPEAKHFDDIVLHVVNMLERAIDTMRLDRGVEQWVFIIDMAGYRAATGELTHNKNVVNIFLNQYPERLHRVFIVNAPWLFNAFWKLISPLLPSETRAKACFCSSGAPELIEQIGAETLESVLGGNKQAKFDFETYWSAETMQFELVQKHLEKLRSGEADGEDVDGEAALSPRSKKKKLKKKKKNRKESDADAAPANAEEAAATATAATD